MKNPLSGDPLLEGEEEFYQKAMLNALEAENESLKKKLKIAIDNLDKSYEFLGDMHEPSCRVDRNECMSCILQKEIYKAMESIRGEKK